MGSRVRLVMFGAAIAALCVGLSACTPTPDPLVIKTPTSTPSTTPAPAVAARIQINGDSLDVFSDDGSSMAHFAYLGDSAASVAALTALIPEVPTTSTTTVSGACEAPHHIVNWGDALELRWSVDTVPGTGLQVTSLSRRIGSTEVETPGGFGVGDSASALLAKLPGAAVNTEYSNFPKAGMTYINYDVKSDRGGSVYADTLDGPIERINAPASTFGDC